ncbi:hypothetical protein A6M21_05755 [Desulfotomaculum copahuensis]|uniref:Uncharacterized protein n=1 Tax=Desulfotomaculum copahuensis TaxID=1838280 RepID=A0A1B7LH04_9FIRM|nr:hypothetical protein A6M21_05755 [Desulfotomaculum copahuensis]
MASKSIGFTSLKPVEGNDYIRIIPQHRLEVYLRREKSVAVDIFANLDTCGGEKIGGGRCRRGKPE